MVFVVWPRCRERGKAAEHSYRKIPLGELLDTANVFPIGTDQHAVFTTEYLARMAELKGFDATGSAAEFTDLDIVVLFDEEAA